MWPITGSRGAGSVPRVSRSYLDHASTVPLRPEARDAMVAALDELVGDPGRIHEEGLRRAAGRPRRDRLGRLVEKVLLRAIDKGA